MDERDYKAMNAKINKGILESKKWKAMQITKSLLTSIWSVTVFPLILFYLFITEKN